LFLEEEFNEVEQVEQNVSRLERDDILTIKDELVAAKEELSFVKEELHKAKESSDNNLNKLKYMVADFDNYRKQMDKQVASKIEENKAELMLRFLNIRDVYVRSVEIAKQSKADLVVVEGLEGILKNFDHLLKSEGVIEIETVETPFDPNVHDAISFLNRDDLPENTVTNEIRKGYMLDNKVLRPSLVEISKKIVKNTVNGTEKAEKGTEN
jgi:molecular chaperone GrpE